ncbi:MAG: hypothetical protein WCZ47_03965 [Bacilli bacterium]|jgi:hypothetical protein|nr:hypothetical protein [Bacilli bacterium]
MSKYNPLWNCIKEKSEDVLKMTFDEVQEVLGFKIDHSFLTYKKELLTYGYEIIEISLKEKAIIIKKITKDFS